MVLLGQDTSLSEFLCDMSLEDIMSTYSRTDLIFEFGQVLGCLRKMEKKILDFNSGIAVNALGHCHPHLVNCLQSQIKVMALLKFV